MGVKNVKICNTSGGNTGTGNCWNNIGIPRAIIFVPLGKKYPTTTIQAFVTALQADIIADNPQLRAYPIQNIVEPKDNTKAPNEQTFAGDGSVVISGENAYDLSYQWTDGGFCVLYALRKSKGQQKAFFTIDSFGQIIGTDGGGDNIMGVPAYNYTNPFTWAVANTAVAAYTTRLVFRPEYVNDNIAILDFTNDGGLAFLESLQGLQNVTIQQGAARAGGVLAVKAVTNCGNTDLWDLYATELAVPGAFQVRNTATKNPLTVTAVASVSTYRGWSVTVSISDPNYTATVGGLEVALIGPTELASLLMTTDGTGYESDWNAF